MDETEAISTKSSNEILSELFGAFNAEPPKIVDKVKSSSEDNDSDHSKKSKKSKRKKSKKKHKKKSKKHKKKHSNTDSDRESNSSITKTKKKKKKSKDKKSKKNAKSTSPGIDNITVPVNQVPEALEVILDETSCIKADDNVMFKNLNNEPEKAVQETDVSSTNNNDNGLNCTNDDKTSDLKTENKKPVTAIKIPEVFESEPIDQNEKQKKGKIQIRNLKFSSVFQETVKAVEEKQKREEERKAEIEEGELSESSESDEHMDCDDSALSTKDRRKSYEEEKSYHSDLKCYYKREDLRTHLKKRKSRSSRYRRRSTSRSRSRSASRSRSRSRNRSHSRYYSHDKISHKRPRSRSRSRDYHSSYYSGDRKRSRKSSSSPKRSHHSRSTDRHRSRSRTRRSRDRTSKSESSHRCASKDRSKTKSKERSESVEKIDKEKLLAIARKNALKLIDSGLVTGSEKLTTIKAGGKTVNELTEYCKKLSKKEALGKSMSDKESESSDEEAKPFHHPFQVRDRSSSIIMNIKNSIPLPVKSLQEKAAEQSKQLRLQFPVSSGSSHRRTESEWVPVSPKKGEPEKQLKALPQANMPPPLPFTAPLPVDKAPVRVLQPHIPMPPATEFSAVPPPEPFNRPVFPVIQPCPPTPKLDISTIVSKRLEAMRKLQENPNDTQALHEMYNAQQEMQYWAESKQEPGAFTGTTGVKLMSATELNSGVNAWAKRDQLKAATPVKGGMGMALLQKMGWQPGEGLGKNKEGTLEPLRLEVKMDKKGLVASDESKRSGKKGQMIQQGPPLPTVKTLNGKHPVSLLNEFCSRRRYGVPQFELCFECGPDHKKNFLFKVKVNGMEYTPSVASPNKKQAKAEAAAICLRALGVISQKT